MIGQGGGNLVDVNHQLMAGVALIQGDQPGLEISHNAGQAVQDTADAGDDLGDHNNNQQGNHRQNDGHGQQDAEHPGDPRTVMASDFSRKRKKPPFQKPAQGMKQIGNHRPVDKRHQNG